jgi:hypothetical protein
MGVIKESIEDGTGDGGTPIQPCQCLMGNCVVMTVACRSAQSSVISSRYSRP